MNHINLVEKHLNYFRAFHLMQNETFHQMLNKPVSFHTYQYQQYSIHYFENVAKAANFQCPIAQNKLDAEQQVYDRQLNEKKHI